MSGTRERVGVCARAPLMRMGPGEALIHVLFWPYNQKGIRGALTTDEIIETRESAQGLQDRTRITTG